MKNILTTMLVVLFLQTTFAKLQDTLPKNLTGIERAAALNQYARNILETNPEKSREFSMKAKELADALGDNHELSNALNYIGLAYYNQKQYEEAINFFQQSLRVSLRLGARDRVGNLFQKIGMSYLHMKSFSKAIFYYQQTVRVFEQLGYEDHVANTYFELGVVYFLAKEYSNSANALNSSIESFAKMDNPRGKAKAYNQLGLTFEEMGNLKKSLAQFQQALQIHQMFHNRDQMAFMLNNMGRIYIKLRLFDEAESTLKQALNYCSTDYAELQSRLHLNLGRIAFFRKQYNLSETALNKSFQIADSIKNRILLADLYHSYYQLYFATNDNRRALENYQLYVALKDTTAIEQHQSQLVPSRQVHSDEDGLYISLIIIQFLIIAGLVLLVLMLRKQRDKARELLQEYNIPT
jgi:tetratricopeptide (TPR) repeat protein